MNDEILKGIKKNAITDDMLEIEEEEITLSFYEGAIYKYRLDRNDQHLQILKFTVRQSESIK